MAIRRRLIAVSLVAALTVASAATGVEPAAAATVPPGFTDSLVVSLPAPTAFAFHPDGRAFVTTQPGQVRIVQGGALLATPALDLSASLCSNSERGLLGIALDPNVTTNGFVYLYYTANTHASCTTGAGSPNLPVNRVSRFTLSGNTISPASQLILLDGMPSPAGNHNGGDVHIGNDGNLYVSIGDGGCDYAGNSGCAGANDAARDLNVLTGKILRVTLTGGIPAGNPFTGAGTARCNAGGVAAGTTCQEIFATGLRNPFRMAFDPNSPSTVFRINDVGQSTWEEIDAGTAGADYGWNVREGHCANGSTTSCGAPPAGMTNPIFDYGRSDGCGSITGGAFVPNGAWPSGYDGDYLFSDYVCGNIFRLEPNGTGGFTRTNFATGLGGSSAVHLGFGPSPTGGQALYYTTYAAGGQIRRIDPPAVSGPVASFTATPSTGPAPLSVRFDGAGSTGTAPLTYSWTFGDGATATTTNAIAKHRYAAGSYTASLVVTDGGGNPSAPVTQSITATASGNTPPSASITSPAAGTRFAVGQSVTVTGGATDAQDGTLGPDRLSWQILLHHVPTTGGEHTHPIVSGTGASISFAYPAPEDLDAAARSYVEAVLTATDSAGATSTVSRRLDPIRVTLSLTSSPQGFQLTLATPSDPTRTVVAPYSFVSWQGWPLTIGAVSPQGGRTFQSWSDGGAQTHGIVTPATQTKYRAAFA